MEIEQKRPFDLDEPRPRPGMTGYERCEADWMAAAGKSFATMGPEDYEALRLACPLYAGREHRERRR